MASLIDLPDGSILFVATTADDNRQVWHKVGNIVSAELQQDISTSYDLDRSERALASILDAYHVQGSIDIDFKPFSASFQPVLDALVGRQGSMGLSPLGARPSTRTMSWPSLRAMGPGFGVSDKLGYDLEDDDLQ